MISKSIFRINQTYADSTFSVALSLCTMAVWI